MGDLPPPSDLTAPPRALVGELVAHLTEPDVARTCADLLRGADPEAAAPVLPYLAGRPGVHFLSGEWTEADYWPRVWGARGLLYAWSDTDTVADAVLTGLCDRVWRVAEMCLKVCVRHELACGDDAVRLAGHDLPRVRATAARALGASGDTEHVAAVHGLLADPSQDVRRAAGRALERMERRLDLPT